MGLLRLFLAICVLLQHSGSSFLRNGSINGAMAVESFFIISGFYISMILDSKYIGIKNYKLFITNRTFKKAEEVAASLNAIPVPYNSFLATLSEVDIVISSVGATDYVLTVQQLKDIVKGRRQSPLLIIDIGVPRNIDPNINKFENVFLHDLDSLTQIVEQNHSRRRSCIPSVNAIMLEELTEFNRWYQSRAIVPTIERLHELYDTIRKEELEYHIHKFNDKDKEVIDLITRRIVTRLIHLPVSELRNGKGDSTQQREIKLQVIREMFGIHNLSHEKLNNNEKK